MWDTEQSDFKSANTPAKRDFVGELDEQCRKKSLGLCLHYSHKRGWRNPNAPGSTCVWAAILCPVADTGRS